MTYTNAEHTLATARMKQAQDERLEALLGHPFLEDVHLPDRLPLAEESGRAVESMAPENYGRRRHRAQTVTFRAEIAARTDRTTARHKRWADGPQPSPGPNRAQRRANPGKGPR